MIVTDQKISERTPKMLSVVALTGCGSPGLKTVWIGVERARADVAEDDAERADSEGGPGGGAPVHTPIFADWRSAGVWRASRTGARSMVQPTAKMKNAEQTANTRRPRRNGVSLLTFAQTGLRPSTLQRRRSGRRM